MLLIIDKITGRSKSISHFLHLLKILNAPKDNNKSKLRVKDGVGGVGDVGAATDHTYQLQQGNHQVSISFQWNI